MKKLKSGFTLVELMVFFMFISLLMAAATPIITKRIKDIPTRIYHGKYVCYRNATGQLEEYYYNSTRRVSGGVVSQCTFTPPKKAALYKIELAGAGAGGFQYIPTNPTDMSWDVAERKTITYDVKAGTMDPPKPIDLSAGGSDAFAYPTGQMIQDMLTGENYRVTVGTGSGGNGGNVRVTYVPALDVNIEHGPCDDGFGTLDPTIKPIDPINPCPDACYTAWCNNMHNFPTAIPSACVGNCAINQRRFEELCPDYNDIYTDWNPARSKGRATGFAVNNMLEGTQTGGTLVQPGDGPIGSGREDWNNSFITGGSGGGGGNLGSITTGGDDGGDGKGEGHIDGINIKPACSWVEEQIEEIRDKIKATYLDCESSNPSSLWCHGVPDSYLENIIKTELINPIFGKYSYLAADGQNYAVMTSWYMGANSADTGRGAYGGRSSTLYYESSFNFRVPTRVPYDNTVAYLKDLLNNKIQVGSTTSAGSCAGWRNVKPRNGINGSSKDFVKEGNGYNTVEADDGGDVLTYAAVRVVDSNGRVTCYTPTAKPKGGKGGYVISSPGRVEGTYASAWESELIPLVVTPFPTGTAFNAVRITGESISDRFPIIKVVTTLNQRNHRVGKSGTSAQPAQVYYAPVLGDDCVFNVAEGGLPIDSTYTQDQIEVLQKRLNTTLSCNSGSLNLVAEGGVYMPSTITISHSGFEKVNGNGQFVNLDRPWFSADEEPMGVSIDRSNVFTRFVAAIVSPVGAGGRGNTITDRCTQPYGGYDQQLWFNGVATKSSHYNLAKAPCDQELEIGDALPGTGGAIVISW